MTNLRLRVIFLLIFVALPLYVAVLGAILVRFGSQDRAQNADAIIVFGARVQAGGNASPILRARTRHAYELWKRGLAPKIVCTGGVGTYLPAEAIASRSLLLGWGVPSAAILVDDKSVSTRENARNAAALLPRGSRVIAVSEAFHLWRCRRECAKFSLIAFTSPETGGWNALRWQSRCFYTVREVFAVTRDVFTS